MTTSWISFVSYNQLAYWQG